MGILDTSSLSFIFLIVDISKYYSSTQGCVIYIRELMLYGTLLAVFVFVFPIIGTSHLRNIRQNTYLRTGIRALRGRALIGGEQ